MTFNDWLLVWPILCIVMFVWTSILVAKSWLGAHQTEPLRMRNYSGPGTQDHYQPRR